MVTSELLDFIRIQTREGLSKETLEPLLLSEGGWSKEDIAEAFASISSVSTTLPFIPPPPALPVAVQSKKDVTSPVALLSRAEVVSPVAPLPVIEKNDQPLKPEMRRIIPIPIVASAFEKKVLMDTTKGIDHKALIATPPANAPGSPEDDFLGIFSATLAEAPVVVSVKTESSSMAQEIKPPLFEEPPTFTQKIAAKVLSAPESMETPSTAQVAQPLSAPSQTFKLDLTKIRSTTAPVGGMEIGKPIEQILPNPVSPTLPEEEIAFALPVLTTMAPPKEQMREVKSTIPVEKKDVILDMTEQKEPSPKQPPAPFIPSNSLMSKRTMASDLLLRETKTALAGIPIVSIHEALSQVTSAEHPPQASSVPEGENIPLAEEIKKKNNMKRVTALLIGGVALCVIFGIALFVFFKLREPSGATLVGTAIEQFSNASTFSYKGSGTMDLVLATATNGVPRSGIMKFSANYDGSLENSIEGFGNGLHHVNISGELQSGTFQWLTNIETDLRMIGSVLYAHVLAFPEGSDLDADLFKTYWVKVDLSEIAKELALSGIAVNQEQYGNFGGQNSETTFNALMKKTSPWNVNAKLPDEQVTGISAHHLQLKANPDNMLEFALSLYRKYSGKELVLTDDQRVRLKNALAKIVGDAWIDKKTGALLQVSFAVDFDDDIVDVRVIGPLRLSFTFANWNTPVVLEVPTPILTQEELRVRMENFRKLQTVRQHDHEKVDRLNAILDALFRFNQLKGRYPNLLSELYSTHTLATSTVDATQLKEYFYAPYVSASPLTKANRCTLKGKTCAYYHIGVNLDDTEDPILQNDADLMSDVRGADTQGCGNEAKVSCYDLAPPVTSPLAPLLEGATGTPAH